MNCELCHQENPEDMFKLDDMKVCSACYEGAVYKADADYDAFKEGL